MTITRDPTTPGNGVAAERDSVRAAREVLSALLGVETPLDVALFDDTPLYRAPEPARATIRLRDPELLRAVLLPPSDIAAGRAFIEGSLDIDGDVESVFAAIEGAFVRRSPVDWAVAARALLRIPRPKDASEPAGRPPARLRGREHSRARDEAAIAYHYDLPPEFYALWLDTQMTYSCAYFREPGDSLETAQLAKYDHIARKLGLRGGERVLDIGCGWGGFVRFAAREYGARAVGVTLSKAQAAYAARAVERDGLDARCAIERVDYRDLSALGTFDKVASIGMFEHVGRKGLPTYFSAAFTALRPGGLFLNHGISWQMPRVSRARAALDKMLEARSSFMGRYVFPDGRLVHVDVALAAAEGAGFEVRDLENLREHYARTLRIWGERLAARADEAAALVNLDVVRTWQLYLAASARAFDSGRMGLVQMLLAKRDAHGRAEVPPTRAHLYERAATASTSAK